KPLAEVRAEKPRPARHQDPPRHDAHRPLSFPHAATPDSPGAPLAVLPQPSDKIMAPPRDGRGFSARDAEARAPVAADFSKGRPDPGIRHSPSNTPAGNPPRHHPIQLRPARDAGPVTFRL